MKNKQIPILEAIKLLGGHRATIAKDSGTTEQQLNNYVNQRRHVLELVGGGYVVVTGQTQILK